MQQLLSLAAVGRKKSPKGAACCTQPAAAACLASRFLSSGFVLARPLLGFFARLQMLRTTLSSSSSFSALLCSSLLSSAHPYPSRHHHHHYSLRLSKLRHHLQAIASRNLSKSSSLPPLSIPLSHLTPSECATVCVRVCLKSLLRRSFYTHLAAAADEQLRHQAPNLSINNLQTRFQCGSLK